MTQHRSVRGDQSPSNYYQRLGVAQGASAAEIRQAYRQKSKLYHPDTTSLPATQAAEQFRQVNEAYAVLSNPEQRQRYDRQQRAMSATSLGSVTGKQRPPQARRPRSVSTPVNLDPKQRELSAGEVFALFLLGITFVGCLALALVLGANRSHDWLQDLPLVSQWQQSWQQVQHIISERPPVQAQHSPAKVQQPPATEQRSQPRVAVQATHPEASQFQRVTAPGILERSGASTKLKSEESSSD